MGGGGRRRADRDPVRPHPVFKREGDDILVEVPITLDEAVLGGKVEVPTSRAAFPSPSAGLEYRADAQAQGPRVKRGAAAGDELVRLTVVMPDRIDDDFKAFAEEWRDNHRYDPRRKLKEQA